MMTGRCWCCGWRVAKPQAAAACFDRGALGHYNGIFPAARAPVPFGWAMTISQESGSGLRYFKRFQMQAELVAPLPPVPSLPEGYAWGAWDERLLDAHAEVKYHCFRGEIDG